MLPAAALLTYATSSLAQDIEPRAFSNAPTGVNFLIGGYALTRGGLSFDTAVPVTDAQLNTSSAVLGYARELDLWACRRSSMRSRRTLGSPERLSLPGRPVERTVNGLGDALFRLSINFLGRPR